MTDVSAITVHRSLPRVIDHDGIKYRMVCEDWPTVRQAEQAAEIVVETAKMNPALLSFVDDQTLDGVADHIMGRLGIDPETVSGCSVIVEAIKREAKLARTFEQIASEQEWDDKSRIVILKGALNVLDPSGQYLAFYADKCADEENATADQFDK